MCSSHSFQQWQADALHALLSRDHKLVLLIRDARKPVRKGFTEKLRTFNWDQLVFKLCNRYFFRHRSRQRVDMSGEVSGIPELSCNVETKGFSEYFSRQDIDQIRSYDLDFIIRFGFNILRGEILNAAKHGIWSYHHDDEQKYRGGPAGLWEIYYGDPVNGVILQRLTEKLDAGIILKKGWFKTVDHSYSANLDQLLLESAAWIAQAATAISLGLPVNTEPSATRANVFKVPGNLKCLWFLVILFRNKIRFHYRELFLSEKWNIAIISRPVHEVISLGDFMASKPVWMKEAPTGSYYADPFGFSAGGKDFAVFEHFSYAKGKATIATAEIKNVGILPGISDAIVTPDHQSYPYTFEDKGEIYCTPESFTAKKIALYSLNKDIPEFVLQKLLLDGIEAVDPTLFFFNGYWWLFFTLKRQSNTELHAWYSEELWSEFRSHLNNPVKTDVRSSRPAGTPFQYQGALYRPAQDCSTTYGARVVINKVVRLTPSEFEEIPVKVISPFMDSPYTKGLHTLSGWGTFTLIDSKRFTFSFASFRSQFSKKYRHLVKRNNG